MSEHRAELRRAGNGRWDVFFDGQQIVSASKDPEREACRALLARGLTGRVLFVHQRGTVACGMNIEKGAALAKRNPPTRPTRAGS